MRVAYRLGRRDHIAVDGDELGCTVATAAPDRVVLDELGHRRTFRIGRVGDQRFVDGEDGHVTMTVLPRHPEPGAALAAGSLVAPDAGQRRCACSSASAIASRAGQALVVVEAMKMEHQMLAPGDGAVG